MRRRTRTSTTAVVAVVVALAVAGCGGSDATTSRTSAGGAAPAQGPRVSLPAATFAIPRGWERADAAATERALGATYRVRAVLSRSGDSAQVPTASLVVLESPVTGAGPQASADFPVFKRAYLDGLRAQLSGGLEPVVRPDVRVDGHPGIVVDVRDPGGNANAVRQIGTVDGDDAFYLQVTVAPGKPRTEARAGRLGAQFLPSGG